LEKNYLVQVSCASLSHLHVYMLIFMFAVFGQTIPR